MTTPIQQKIRDKKRTPRQIAEMVKRLDESPGRKEKVFVYNFENMDPQDVQQILQDLFNRNSTMRTSTSSRNSMINNNPLTTRETQNTQSSSSTTTGSVPACVGATGGYGGFYCLALTGGN